MECLRDTVVCQNNLTEDEESDLPQNALARYFVNKTYLEALSPPSGSPIMSFTIPRKIDDLRALILRLGGEFEDEFEGLTYKIEKSDCWWEVNIQNGSITLASKTIETRKATNTNVDLYSSRARELHLKGLMLTSF
ncbi:MAG: hypothetical protein ACFFBD_11460 [Candidatus Hodarchaeota archaeon]